MNGLRLPPGWVIADAWSEQSAIVSVAAGAGINATAYASILAREIPAGARVYIDKLFLRVVDMAAYDQLFFALRRNGALIAPWDKVSAEMVVEEFFVDVGETFHSGMLEIVAANISGTTQPTAAPDPVPIRCIARFKGYLLTEQRLPRSARG